MLTNLTWQSSHNLNMYHIITWCTSNLHNITCPLQINKSGEIKMYHFHLPGGMLHSSPLPFKVCSEDRPHWHHLGANSKCRISFSAPDPPNQNLHFIKIPRGFVCALKFEKDRWGASANEFLFRYVLLPPRETKEYIYLLLETVLAFIPLISQEKCTRKKKLTSQSYT